MKREQIPVILSHENGTNQTLGHISRITTSCLTDFLRKKGLTAIKYEGCKYATWNKAEIAESLPPGHKRIQYTTGPWKITVERTA